MLFRKKILAILCLALLTGLFIQILSPASFTPAFTAHAASKVKLNKKSASLKVGETLKLEVTGSNSKVKWSSSNKKIAKVNSDGLVTAKKAGKATITAKVGKKKLKCKVTVKKAAKSNVDYQDAASFEAALNSGLNLEGKIVRFVIDKIAPDSAFGYNLQAGEHLNFCSTSNPNVNEGDTITVKVVGVTSFLGSYIITYKKV